MSLRTRVTLVLVLSLVALAATTAYTVTKLREWHEAGMVGVAFMAPLPRGKTPPLAMFSSGRIFMVYPGGSADESGLRSGDVIVSIDGIPLKDNDKLVARAGGLKTGHRVTYRIQRDGKLLDIVAPLVSPLSIPLYLLSCGIAAAVALAYAAIGVLVFLKRPEDPRVTVFYAMVIVGALYLVFSPGLTLESSNIRGLHAEVTGKNMLPFAIFAAVLIAFLPLTLHLALVFPRERPIFRTSPHVLRWVYGIPGAVVIAVSCFAALTSVVGASPAIAKRLDLPLNVFAAALTLGGLFTAWRIARLSGTEGVRLAFWRRPLQSIFVGVAVVLGIGRVLAVVGSVGVGIAFGIAVATLPVISLAAYPVLSCIALYRSYREAGAEERRQVKWPLWGTISALVIRMAVFLGTQVVGLVMMVGGGDTGSWLKSSQTVGAVSTLAYLLIPISFAVAILKYRLMNIDVIIKKTVVYAILSGLIIVVYLGLVGGLGTILVNAAGVHNQTMVVAATLVVALAFVPMRNKLQSLVERNLFRHRFAYPDAVKAVAAEALIASDASAFLASGVEKIQQALQSRAVMIFAERHDEFVAAAKVGVADSLVGSLRIARGPVGHLLDRPFDPRLQPLPDDAKEALRHLEAVLVVPINTPGTPANGMIAVASKLSGASYEIEDVEFLRAVADQLDVGIDRIRQQREDADYSQARTIQQSLLPREMPQIAGLDVSGIWLSARTMGGDYFDVIELAPTQLAVCIGDVAGKGMPAALLMSGLQAAVRASASDSPRDVCERVRRVVVSSLTGGRFVTFFYATVDVAAMRLRWTNAGHNAPVLARGDGTVVRLDEGGPAISRLFRTTGYVEKEIPLQPGDRLVLFTDGVSEAAADDGEQFGEQRIEELATRGGASAADLQQAIVTATTAFAREIEDDLTLVVVKVAG
jgi:serine phosphatase RsbU (regulator of sigma subunit)